MSAVNVRLSLSWSFVSAVLAKSENDSVFGYLILFGEFAAVAHVMQLIEIFCC